MTNTITYVRGDDWEGLYLNGVIHYQNHSLRVGDVLDILNTCGGKVDNVVQCDVCYDWMEKAGYLPALFSEIPLDVIQ